MWKKSEEDSFGTERTRKPLAQTNKPAPRGVSTIGGQAVVNGEIAGNEDLLVMGKYDGTIILNKNIVTVGKSGSVKGKIQGKIVMVEGKVEGDINATDKIVLKATANVKANLLTAKLVMDEGCHFQGSVDMSNVENKPKPAPAKSQAIPSKGKPEVKA